jgi:glycosyltransferase involved in cell wall biosynthesis
MSGHFWATMTANRKSEDSLMVRYPSPRTSIGLPVYNGERYLAAAIESLLAQTYSDFELIISDNASTDGTEEICRTFVKLDSRIKYHRSKVNHGAALNFNRAFELSRGHYFKWAAHDDLQHQSFLQRCISVLEQDPSVVLCFTGTQFIDDEGMPIREYKFPVDVNSATRRELFLLYAGGGHIVHEIFGVIRAEALRTSPLIGGYVGSDLVLLAALALRGRFHQVPEILFEHREHKGRSARSTGGARGYARWFDPSKSARFVMPHWRRMLENTSSVVRAPLQWREKARLITDIGRAARWNSRTLVAEILQLVRPGG